MELVEEKQPWGVGEALWLYRRMRDLVLNYPVRIGIAAALILIGISVLTFYPDYLLENKAQSLAEEIDIFLQVEDARMKAPFNNLTSAEQIESTESQFQVVRTEILTEYNARFNDRVLDVRQDYIDRGITNETMEKNYNFVNHPMFISQVSIGLRGLVTQLKNKSLIDRFSQNVIRRFGL